MSDIMILSGRGINVLGPLEAYQGANRLLRAMNYDLYLRTVFSGLMEQAAIHFGAARRLRSRQSFRLALRDECVGRQRRLRRPVTGARTLQ